MLLDRDRSWSELNCSLDGLPREGQQYYLTVHQLMAAWLRCWQKTNGLEQYWSLPRNVQMETALRFEILTVRNLLPCWESGSWPAEQLHWEGLSQETVDACGFWDLLGRPWREEQIRNLHNYHEAIERISAQNFRLRHLTFGPGYSLARNQDEKERIYMDRWLAAKFIFEHTTYPGDEDFLEPAIEYFERGEAQRD